MGQESQTNPSSDRAWTLLLDRLRGFEERLLLSDERDTEAWREYRARCEAEDKAKAGHLADTAAMVERGRAETARDVERVRALLATETERARVATAATIEAGHQRLVESVNKRFKAVWAELKRRPGATRPPFWANVTGRFLIIAALIALALLAAMFNARNFGELCLAQLAKLAGQ